MGAGAGRVSGGTVEVVRIDGARLSCAFEGASETVIRLACEGESVEIAIEDLRSMRLAGAVLGNPIAESRKPKYGRRATDDRKTHVGDVDVYPAAGGRFRANIKARSGDESAGDNAEGYVVADTAIGANVRIPLSALAGVWLGRAGADPKGRELFDEGLADRLPGTDVLVTQRDGEVGTIRGSVVALGPEGGRIVLNRKERSFGFDRVLGIVFATGLPTGERWPVTVRMGNGTEFAGRLLGADASVMRFEASFGARVAVTMGELSWLRFDSERLVSVSALTPLREEAEGLLHEGSPARFDRSVANGALVVDGRGFEHGIGVRARSRLEYDVAGAYETFAAVIGIDDAVRPRGSVVFRVEGDGEALFDSGLVTGRDAGKEVLVDVRGVSRLALVVEYGADMDLSDHANWGDARLIRTREGDTTR